MAPTSSPPILRSGPPMLLLLLALNLRLDLQRGQNSHRQRHKRIHCTDRRRRTRPLSSPAPPTSARTQERHGCHLLLGDQRRHRCITSQTGYTIAAGLAVLARTSLATEALPAETSIQVYPQPRFLRVGRSRLPPAKTWETDGATTTCTCTPQPPSLDCRCYRLRHDPHCDNQRAYVAGV